MFDVKSFFQAYGIEYKTEGHKHCRPGWIQTECPFCIGNPGYHLGYELSNGWWNCWRCGYHKTWDVLIALLGSKKLAKDALHKFQTIDVIENKVKIRGKKLELPIGLQPLTKRAQAYLEHRKFDPDLLETLWKLQSTGNIGPHKFRIYIPIYLQGHVVSWQCRDITEKSNVRYLGQSQDKEILSNKETLYGIDSVTGDSCVVVEGVTDVWRLGPGAVATFGVKYTSAQVKMLIKRFKRIHILFDPPDPQAQIQAEKLANTLSKFGREAVLWNVDSDVDPGDMEQDDADAFMRDALSRSSGY